MGTYDLSSLDDKEFEVLCCRLLSAREGKHFEHFKPGRDLGVDGRYFAASNQEWILQCKHWARSTVPALLRALENGEAPKVRKLNPARYMVATSLPLGRTDKDKIVSLFGNFVQSPADILGREDVEDLLAKNPDIVRQHPTLWLASAEVLQFIHNAAILGRSDFSLQQIAARTHRYVHTRAHDHALKKLEQLGVVLITGLPGIGKTTLAEQLCLTYATLGYQLCVLSGSVEEAEDIFASNKNQLFYFDDFLGRNYLDALERHEDSKIASFIGRIQRDQTKRLVLTSRTTVLNRAKILSDQFGISKIDRTELEIRVEHLGELDRAHILHKHIWYSDVPIDALHKVLQDRRYITVIRHRNFNPRLIEFVTDAQRAERSDLDNYWEYVERTLARPTAVWQHVFENQLDDFSRALLLLCCYNGASAFDENGLREAFSRFKQHPTADLRKGSADFLQNARLATGSVLNRILMDKSQATYALFNPSVADYVYERMAEDAQSLTAIFACLNSLSSIKTLEAQIQNKIIKRHTAKSIVESLCAQKLLNEEIELPYSLVLARLACHLCSSSAPATHAVKIYLQKLTPEVDEDFGNWEKFIRLLSVCVRLQIIHPSTSASFFAIYRNRIPDFEELNSLCELYTELPEDIQSSVLPDLKASAVEFWRDAIHQTAAESGTFDEYVSEDDADQAGDMVEAFVMSQLDDYPFEFSVDEIESIESNVDVGDLIYNNQRRAARQSDDRVLTGPTGARTIEAIDDLFRIDFPRAS